MLSDNALMHVAGIIGESATCSRLRVGAVLTIDRRIISTGYNGAPRGMPHCSHLEKHQEWCEITVHAEANVIAFAAKHGVKTQGSVLYTTHSPCLTCTRLLINAGVEEVIYEHEYRDTRGLNELKAAGVKVTGPYGPGLSTVSTPRGDGESLYPSESSDTGPTGGDYTRTDTPDFDRRGSGL